MTAILQELLRVSEKAAHIARACRQHDALFQLLVQEKRGAEKNRKFAVDFKTLADVLVQEVIRRHLEDKFPGLEERVLGEESNEFTNTLGEKIVVRLCPTEAETAELLSTVLGGNQPAAAALARAVHEDVAVAEPGLDAVQVAIPQDILGIWVDPIDSTQQYIEGAADVEPRHGVFARGLACVTILIGAYDLRSGLPLMGVINQPFVAQDPVTRRWEGRRYWGLSYMGTNVHSVLPADPGSSGGPAGFSAVVSASEREPVRAALARVCGDRVFPAAGAGYKGLCVVQGLVDVYVFSHDSTFKWDACAPHAVLRALGGGVADLRGCLAPGPAAGHAWPQLRYHRGHADAAGVDRWANRGGLIAYRSPQRLDAFLGLLRQHLPPGDLPADMAVDTPADTAVDTPADTAADTPMDTRA